MSDMPSAKLPTPAAQNDFIFVDAKWDIWQTYRRDALQLPFFEALKQKCLVGVRDPVSGHVLFPPRGFSEQSYTMLDALVPVGPGGVIRTLTQVPGGKDRPAFLVVFVQLDGADTASAGRLRGPGSAIERLSDLIGARCTAVFKDEPKGDWGDYWFELQDISGKGE